MKLKKFSLTWFGVLLLQAGKRNSKVREKDWQKKSELYASFLSLIKNFQGFRYVFIQQMAKIISDATFSYCLLPLPIGNHHPYGKREQSLEHRNMSFPSQCTASQFDMQPPINCYMNQLKWSCLNLQLWGHNLPFLGSVILTSPEKHICSCPHSYQFRNS